MAHSEQLTDEPRPLGAAVRTVQALWDNAEVRPTHRLLIALGALVVASVSCGGEGSGISDPPSSTTSITAPVDGTSSSTTISATAPVDGTSSSTTTTTGAGFEIPGDLGDAPLVLPPLDRGVLVEQRWIDPDTFREIWRNLEVASDGLTVTLTACRVRYPGQWAFDVTLEAPVEVEFPITLGLELSWGFGDVWTGAPPMEVDLAAAGSFTVTYDTASYMRDHTDQFLDDLDTRQREETLQLLLSGISGSSATGWEGAGCGLQVDYSPNAAVTDRFVFLDGEVTADLVSPEGTATEGTVEYLAQTADLTDRFTPARSWAQLYGHGWSPVAPVVWMEPDRSFSSLSEQWTLGGRCYTLRIQYHHDEGDPYEVWQYQGCRADGPATHQPAATLTVGNWTIVAAGEDQAVVDAAIERLKPFFVTTPSPEPPTAPGTTIAETTFNGATVYLVRLDHGDGIAEILLESPDIDFSNGPGSGANGEMFRGCWQTTVYHDPGIALVLVGDPTWDVRVGDTTLNLHEAEGGIGYALIEWTSNQPPHPSITTPDGSAPCS